MGNKLSKYTDEELRQELLNRDKERRPPKPLDKVDFTPVIDIVKLNVNTLAAGEYINDDFDYSIFSAAMEAVYGKDIWLWWDKAYGKMFH